MFEFTGNSTIFDSVWANGCAYLCFSHLGVIFTRNAQKILGEMCCGQEVWVFFFTLKCPKNIILKKYGAKRRDWRQSRWSPARTVPRSCIPNDSRMLLDSLACLHLSFLHFCQFLKDIHGFGVTLEIETHGLWTFALISWNHPHGRAEFSSFRLPIIFTLWLSLLRFTGFKIPPPHISGSNFPQTSLFDMHFAHVLETSGYAK